MINFLSLLRFKAIMNKKTTKTKVKNIPAPAPQPVKKPILYWLLFILLATLVFYFPTFRNGFVNWDDDIYIINNPYIHSLSAANIRNIFTSFYNGNYHPLTMLSYAFDLAVAGQKPFLYHLVNVFFHLLNTCGVFIMVYKLTGAVYTDKKTKPGLTIPIIAALLFGLHPFHVESVSWVSERKDVLYAFFFIIALYTYVGYTETKKISAYLLTLAFFLLSLLSKGMAVSYSVSIIAIDYLLKRKLLSDKVIAEKVPFLVISLLFGVVAIYAQQSANAVITGDVFSLWDKISFASYGFIQYFIKLFVPFHLSHYYPYPVKVGNSFPSFYYIYPIVTAIGLPLLIFWVRKSRLALFGILFFIINIVPVLKLLPVGDAIMADRYTYVSSIGIFIVIAVLFNYLLDNYQKSTQLIIGILAFYVLFLGIKTYQRTIVWKTTLSLWENASLYYPDNSVVILNRGLYNQSSGNTEAALKDLYRSLQLDPHNDKAYTNIGNIKNDQGDIAGAIEQYNKAIAINPNNEKAYSNRGKSEIDLKKFDVAITDLDYAIKLAPDYKDAYQNRGAAKYLTQRYDDAITDFTSAIKLDPNYAVAYYARGLCYVGVHNNDLACHDFQKANLLNFSGAEAAVNQFCK